jgi:hypothetical protein
MYLSRNILGINWFCSCASRIVTIIKPLLYDSETLQTGLFSEVVVL